MEDPFNYAECLPKTISPNVILPKVQSTKKHYENKNVENKIIILQRAKDGTPSEKNIIL